MFVSERTMASAWLTSTAAVVNTMQQQQQQRQRPFHTGNIYIEILFQDKNHVTAL